jgi:hypothetical protein
MPRAAISQSPAYLPQPSKEATIVHINNFRLNTCHDLITTLSLPICLPVFALRPFVLVVPERCPLSWIPPPPQAIGTYERLELSELCREYGRV